MSRATVWAVSRNAAKAGASFAHADGDVGLPGAHGGVGEAEGRLVSGGGDARGGPYQNRYAEKQPEACAPPARRVLKSESGAEALRLERDTLAKQLGT